VTNEKLDALEMSLRVLLERPEIEARLKEALRKSFSSLFKYARHVEEERDAALAHDTQPYPTAWAYDRLAKALSKKTGELREVKGELASYKAMYVEDALIASEEAVSIEEFYDMGYLRGYQDTLAGVNRAPEWEEAWGVVLDDAGSMDIYATREEADEARKSAPDTGLVHIMTTTIIKPTVRD
jgi:hypothetical protein